MRKVVVVGPVDALFLVVACRRQPRVDVTVLGETLERQEEASFELGAVGGERVDFTARLGASCQAGSRPPRRVAAEGDDVAHTPRPTCTRASDEPIRHVKDQVAEYTTAASATEPFWSVVSIDNGA